MEVNGSTVQQEASQVIEFDIFPEIDIIDNIYGKWQENGNSQPYFKACGRAVWVLEVFTELESGNELLKLEFITNVTSNTTKVVDFPRSLLNAQGASRLCELGIDAQPHNVSVLFQLIQKQEMFLPKTLRHTHLGWAFDSNKNLLFKGKKAIGNQESSYFGGKDVGTRGKYKLWKKMVEEEVIGRTSLEFAVILGLSATLVGYLNEHETCESLLVHLCGDSSTGKTTAARLAVSVAGRPSFDGSTLMATFQSTKNAIIKNVANNYGMPQAFDELSMFSGNLTQLIYDFVGGKDKSRLNSSSNPKVSENWATTIITTGEKSLLTDAKQNAGLSVRVLVFDSIKWTENASHAERITSVITQNYGFATLKFARYLLDYDKQKLQKKIEFWRNAYLNGTTINDKFTERISRKYAILLATASIAKKALGINFEKIGILKFILENEANADLERDLGLKAYEFFLEFVETNPSLFGYKSGNKWLNAKGNQNFGIVEDLGTPEVVKGTTYSQYIIISKTKFQVICSKYGFEDPNIILKDWKNKGILKSERDRLVSDKKISSMGNAVKCYIIRVSSERTALDAYKAQYTRTNGKTGEDEISL